MARDMRTGEVAKLLGVGTSMVIRWCDSDMLASYRVPGSRQRRVRRVDLEKFCVEHNVPLATLDRLAAETNGQEVSSS